MIHIIFVFILILNIETKNWLYHEMSLNEVHPPYCSSWKWFSNWCHHQLKWFEMGNWCGVNTWLTFSIRMSFSTCQLPWFSVANKIFQPKLLISTSWKGVGNVVEKGGFLSNVSFIISIISYSIDGLPTKIFILFYFNDRPIKTTIFI